jgi:hypothetical protein
MEPRAGVTLVNAARGPGPGCSDVNLQWHQLTSPIEQRLALPEHARHPSLPVCLSPSQSAAGARARPGTRPPAAAVPRCRDLQR